MLPTTLIALALAFAPQQAGSPPLSPELEARVQALGKELRCAVCQGLSISDSPASMARAQLDKVRELVTEGQTDAQIREYFVSRYGEWVLLSPSADGLGSAVWILPPLLAAMGGFAGWRYLKRNLRPAEKAQPPERPASNPTGEDPYLVAVREELSK